MVLSNFVFFNKISSKKYIVVNREKWFANTDENRITFKHPDKDITIDIKGFNIWVTDESSNKYKRLKVFPSSQDGFKQAVNFIERLPWFL